MWKEQKEGAAGSPASPGPLTHSQLGRSQQGVGVQWELSGGSVGVEGRMTSLLLLGLCSPRSGGRKSVSRRTSEEGGRATPWTGTGDEERARLGKGQPRKAHEEGRVTSHAR